MAQTVAEQIVDEIAAAYLAETSDSTVVFRFGDLGRATYEGARRVVFVRTGGKIEAPNRTGGKWIRDGFEVSAARYDKLESVTAHIYGEDAGAVELIHENLLVVASNLLKGMLKLDGDYTWRNETEAGSAHLTRGHKIEQPMTWRVAIPNTTQTLVYIPASGFSETCSFGGGEYDNAEFSTEFSLAGGELNG